MRTLSDTSTTFPRLQRIQWNAFRVLGIGHALAPLVPAEALQPFPMPICFQYLSLWRVTGWPGVDSLSAFTVILPPSDSLSVVSPIFIVIFGEILDDLNGGDIMDSVRPLVIMFALAGVLGFVGGTIMVRANCL